MNVRAFYPDREQYPISHGNWQNRWKISLSKPSNRLRWTVKSSTATRDLDSKTALALNTDYHVVAVYSGADIELYLNGELDAFASLSGAIAQSTYDLAIGRSLPAEGTYSFNGILDEVRIYNYALSYQDIQELYNSTTDVKGSEVSSLPDGIMLYQNFPNPFNPTTSIRFSTPSSGYTVLKVSDTLGQDVAILVQGWVDRGIHTVTWNAADRASGLYFSTLLSGGRTEVRKMLLVK
jgi:hypothetical protein